MVNTIVYKSKKFYLIRPRVANKGENVFLQIKSALEGRGTKRARGKSVTEDQNNKWLWSSSSLFFADQEKEHVRFEAGFMSASFTKKPVNLQKYIRKLTKFCWKDLKLLRMYVKVEKWITYHQNSGKHPEKCLKTFSALEDALLSHFYNYAKKQTFIKFNTQQN